MTADPIKTLFKRADQLSITMQDLMLEAGVHPGTAYNWKRSGSSKSLLRWFKMVADAGIDLPKSGKTTWDALGPDALKIFRDAGYQKIELKKIWMKRDAEQIEAFKKVHETITKHEYGKTSPVRIRQGNY